MKKSLLILLVSLFLFQSPASSQILDKLKNKAKQRADQKVDQSIDKGLDEVEGKNKTKTETSEGEIKEKTKEGETTVKTESKGGGIKSYSKYDFVPGDKIVYSEDFSQDVVGEFPLKWNTNGSGEVVTLEGMGGKWLKLTEGTKYESPYSAKLPENYTVEFDLVLDFKPSMHVPDMEFVLFNPEKMTTPPGIRLFIAPQAGTYGSQNVQNTIDRFRLESYDEKGLRYLQGKDQLNGELFNNKSRPVHIAMWVQKERVRVWVNQLKIYDLPKAVPPGLSFTRLMFETGHYGSDASNYSYYLSNIKVAHGTPDTRNKLITEGKWSTTGILFDINSDKINPVSYPVLKEIATTLTDNPDMKVTIIGHTDSDGDAAQNLDLSKRRAASVRILLTTEFGIDGTRLQTDGSGETKPVGDNNTAEGKAQNRRVEFIKQ